jgi:hypothetical protein
MKKIAFISIITILTISGCKKDEAAAPGQNIASQIKAYPIESLNVDETASLLYMREEEKLAHDVYITLHHKWGTNMFSNITASEQTHSEAVLELIKKYGLVDPVGSQTIGVFSDTTLQKIYNQLVIQGNASSLEAFKVGAAIEDLDIFDLNNWSARIDNQDIKFVYQNLTKGSRNHLRSFYSQITGAGGSYSAQYISQAEFDSIIKSAKETGSW